MLNCLDAQNVRISFRRLTKTDFMRYLNLNCSKEIRQKYTYDLNGKKFGEWLRTNHLNDFNKMFEEFKAEEK